MVDTHTHLYMPEFDVEGQFPDTMTGQCEAVDRALAAGVTMMILPNVDLASMPQMQALHALRPECTRMAAGLHPTELGDAPAEALATIMSEVEQCPESYVAIGEVGIDLYWDASRVEEQMAIFESQLHVARRLAKPVIIHCREGLAQTLEVLEAFGDVKAVFHSFGGTVDDVELIRRHGDYYFGINGIVTFKNSTLGSVLPAIGIDRILTETDSPYLSPAPFRGRRNESARIPLIVRAVASALDMPEADAARMTSNNAYSFFGITP